MTNEELRGLVGVTMQAVLGGSVEPGVANSVAALARAYIAVEEAGSVETLQRQVDELRALIAARGIAS
jgi:hypothetical protein